AAPATVSGEPLSTRSLRRQPWEDGQGRGPASQETCPGKMNVHGRGVLVVRLRIRLCRFPRMRPRNPCPNHLGFAMSVPTVSAATLAVPRIGRRRELKFALEAYWSGKLD